VPEAARSSFRTEGPYKLDGAWYWQLAQDVEKTRGEHFERHHRELSFPQLARILRRKFPAKYGRMTIEWLREILLLRKPVAPRKQDLSVGVWNWAAERAQLAVLECVDLTEEQVGLYLLHALITYPDKANFKFYRSFVIPRLHHRTEIDGWVTTGFVRSDGTFVPLHSAWYSRWGRVPNFTGGF
jgi:hypothetical protein